VEIPRKVPAKTRLAARVGHDRGDTGSIVGISVLIVTLPLT